MQGILHLFVIRRCRGGRVRHDFTTAGGFEMCHPSLLPIGSRHTFLSFEGVVALAIELFGEVEAAAIAVAIAAVVAVAVGFIVVEYWYVAERWHILRGLNPVKQIRQLFVAGIIVGSTKPTQRKGEGDEEAERAERELKEVGLRFRMCPLPQS